MDEKLKLPEKNIEYTIAYSGNKIYKYVVVDITSTNRIKFQNTRTGYVTSMTIEWFNTLLKRHQIINKRNLEGYVALPEPPKPVKATDGEQEFWQDVIKRVRNIPEAYNAYVVKLIGYPPSKLADEMENLDKGGYTKEYEYRVMRNVKLVSDFLDKYDFSFEENKIAPSPEVKGTSEDKKNKLIMLLKLISGSKAEKCRAKFGYSIYDLIYKLENLDNKNESYVQSIYKETYRVLEFAGYKAPADLCKAAI